MSSRPSDDDGAGVSSAIATAALALARRFAAGGTLWCWAPGAPQHAQHVAVEFVHPVIVGTRALPAVALIDDDAESTLRPMARAGDALLVVAGADAPVAGVLRRAQAWGLTTVWCGVGAPPPLGAADHVLWLSDDAAAAYDGRLVLGYHVLWELTHVCFEHPGLLVDAIEEGATCTTCSDEGRLGEVVDCDDNDANVRTATGVETVNTLLVGRVQPGDLVLVHAGTAITVVDA
ncbi:MAG: HypC/HybG/HupF family hydrogenase formation chaperone [Acidimicrobiales bacterium]